MSGCNLTIMSFGFKYGGPKANYYFDVGFLKNPARGQWGFFSSVNDEMRSFILEQPKAIEFIENMVPLLKFLSKVDQHQVVALGCNAGRHRSRVLAEELAKRMKQAGVQARVFHRDAEIDKVGVLHE